jgi:hypothetical protein
MEPIMGVIIGFIIMVVGAIYLVNYFSNKIVGKERWCENCNSWSVMKLTGDLKGNYFTCENCQHRNLENSGGCRQCGWYAKFENRYINRIGPIWKSIDYNNSIMVYRETWNCPKHGNYECDVPDSESIDYSHFQE